MCDVCIVVRKYECVFMCVHVCVYAGVRTSVCVLVCAKNKTRTYLN